MRTVLSTDCHPPSGWWTGTIAKTEVMADTVVVTITFDDPDHRRFLNKFPILTRGCDNVFSGYLNQLGSSISSYSELHGNRVAILLKQAERFNGLPRCRLAEMRAYAGEVALA